MLERRELLSIWTVNTTADTGTGSGANHTGDLRYCITQANSDTTVPTIGFAISGSGLQTIKLGSALPQITQPVTIDGASQTGYRGTPLIEIDGSNLADTDAVLSIAAGSATIKALAIDGCPGTGILLTGAAGGLVQGCYIGTPDGTTAKGNGTGIVVYSSSNVTIGGTAAGQGNVISGNAIDGVHDMGTSDLIMGNLIGTNVSGLLTLPNGRSGVFIGGRDNPNNITVGGTANGAGNVIAASAKYGIWVAGALSPGQSIPTGIRIEGNFIGTNSAGASLGNAGDGIMFEGASQNTIGGTAAGAGNVFANSTESSQGGGNGIELAYAANQNTILSNSICNNAGLGINFGNGPTPNQIWPPGPTGANPNGLQNYPVLISALSTGGNTTIQGKLNAEPSTQFLIQFFASPTANSSGFGEGKTYLGSATVTTDSTSNATFSAVFNGVTVPAGSFISATATDPLGNTSEFAKDVPILGVADLGITGRVAASTVYAGDDVTYTFTITNAGPDSASGVQFTDTLPAGLSYQGNFSSVPSGITAAVSGSTVTASVGTMAANATVALSFQAQVQASAVPSITNTGSVTTSSSDPNLSNNSAAVTLSVSPAADLAITGITTTSAPNYVGANLVYTITAANNGLSNATGVTVTDTLPALADVTFVSASTSLSGVTPTITGNVVIADFGDLAAGSTVTLTITVTPTAAAMADLPLDDTASIAGNEHDPNTANNTDSVTTTILASTDLQVGITPSVSPVQAGQNVTYTITATNNGPSNATGVVVTDTIPGDVTLLSAPGGVVNPAGTGKIITFHLATLAEGVPTTFQVTVATTGTTASPTTDSVTITGSQYDANTANNSAILSVPVTAVSDLQVGMSSPTAVYVGNVLTYTITVSNAGPSTEPTAVVTDTLPDTVTATNNGPSPVTGVVVTDTLPPTATDVIFVSTSTGATPDSTGTITFNAVSLASGASVSYVITVQPTLAAVTEPTLVDTANVLGNEFDPNLANNTAQTSTTVSPAVDLAITQFTAAPKTVQIGNDLTYTFVVSNNGPSSATAVTVTSPLGTGVSYVTGSGTATPAGTVSLQGSNVVASLGTLATGASATVTFMVAPSKIGKLTGSASAMANETDTNMSNNSATVSTTVVDRVGTIEFSSAGYAVPDNAGSATLTVSRVDGARGTVTVDYKTAPINATPGLNYTPVSGTLPFPNGVTSETIVIPVLDNPYDNHNELVSVVLSNVQTTETLGKPILGTPSTATLTIQDIDPDFNPLVVNSVQWTGTAQSITQIFVTFSKPLITSTAINPANYALINVGPDGKYGTLDDSAVAMRVAMYQSSSLIVALTPTHPLPANRFFHFWINSATPGGVEDVGDNMLAGNGSTAGTSYTAMLARGTSLNYYTPAGDQVSLKITGGGNIDDLLTGSCQGDKLCVVGEVPHHTILSGSVRKVKGGTGQADLGYTIWGLGNFGDVRVKMSSPLFQITQYPFSPGSVASTAVKPLTAASGPRAKDSPDQTIVAKAMNRPFRVFRR